MVLWYNVHSTDSGSLILGSSEDDEVIQEGLLRLRSVFPTASCTADFVKPKSSCPTASQRVPSDAFFWKEEKKKSLISPKGFADLDVP